MRLIARGAATAIVTVVAFGANAADLDYPPPVVGQPQYGMAPPPPVAPPQVIIIPGPTVSPQYNSATIPPPPVGAPPYGVAPPMAPGVRATRGVPTDLALRRARLRLAARLRTAARALLRSVRAARSSISSPRIARSPGVRPSRCLAGSGALSRSIFATSLSRSNWPLFAIASPKRSSRCCRRIYLVSVASAELN